MKVSRIAKASPTVAAVRAATPTGPKDFDALPQRQPAPEIGSRRRRRSSFNGRDETAVGQKGFVLADVFGPDAGGAQQLNRIATQFDDQPRIARQRRSAHHRHVNKCQIVVNKCQDSCALATAS